MRRVRRFLEPCLLLLLRQGESHGYKLVTELERFGFDLQRLDPSLVYRALRDMEDMAWIRSRHEEDSQGPPRRVYELAPEGEIQLEAWVEDLRRTRGEIGLLLEAYDKNGTDDK
jgi:DNA-binding PadR family transcriptional regulator